MGCSSGKESSQLGNQSLMKKQNKKKCVKIVLLGNVAVGKTSVTQRYVHGKFDPKYYNTLGGAYVEKIVQTQEGESIQLNIWDTAGDERYRSIMPFYYRDAAAAVLVYDVSDSNSFQDLNYWIEELENKVKTEGMVLYLLGNKCDVDPDQKVVTKDMAQAYAEQKDLLFGECSAKTGEGIEDNFQILIKQLEQQNKIAN